MVLGVGSFGEFVPFSQYWYVISKIRMCNWHVPGYAFNDFSENWFYKYNFRISNSPLIIILKLFYYIFIEKNIMVIIKNSYIENYSK